MHAFVNVGKIDDTGRFRVKRERVNQWGQFLYVVNPFTP